MSMHPTIFADTESCPEVWVRVEGRGSFQNCPALKEFSRRVIAEGRRKLVVDLKNCVAMDSTFMGTLASLAIRLRDLGGDFWVVNRNERNTELLAGLGIDSLFSTEPLVGHHGECPEAIHYAANKAETREAIHEAHAACVAVDPRNEEKFKDVIEHLKASAARDAAKGAAM